MEPRDLVGSARPKEGELQGVRVELNKEGRDGAGGINLARNDNVISTVIGEGEGIEEQGEPLLEEQEFSIKEASFQEGSLKLKIQTTKRTKKPPKNLENYICPPEIRMTIRPPVGEAKGGRQGRTGSGTGAGRSQKDEDRGPPRKRTYERQFRAPDQREGGLLQLLGDSTPAKHQPRSTPLSALTHHHAQSMQSNLAQQFHHLHGHQHQITSDWMVSAPSAAAAANQADSESVRELAGACKTTMLDPTLSFSRTLTQSPSPQRSLTPDLQMPVVTDASILNLTSLSRGKVLQEDSEQLFGKIKRKYGRKDTPRTLCNPHSAETPWGRLPENSIERPVNSEERQRFRQEETSEHYHQDREERRKDEKEVTILGRRGDEEDREVPLQTEDGKGRKRRRRPSFDDSFSVEEPCLHQQDPVTTDKHHLKPPEPKVAHKVDMNKHDSRLANRVDVFSERKEKKEKGENSDRAEKEDQGREAVKGVADPELALSLTKINKSTVSRSKTISDTSRHTEPSHNHTNKANFTGNPRLPSPIPSPKSSISPSPSPKPRAYLSPSPVPRATLSSSPSHSTSLMSGSRQSKAKDRWSYLKSKNHTSLELSQQDSNASPSTLADPPSAFPITPLSPLYTNTDSLTVHTPIKRKRGRPKKQPLLTVETIHEGTSNSPPSPLAQETSVGQNRFKRTHAFNTLGQMSPMMSSTNFDSLKMKHARSLSKPEHKIQFGKMQNILSSIMSDSSQSHISTLKSSSAPAISAMNAMAPSIENRLGKQINVSKRGTIYIGKKRGRKPRAEPQNSRDKPLHSASTPSLYDSPLVPSVSSSPSSGPPSMKASQSDATMPSLQPISALPSKPISRSLLSGGWKLSPPRLLANSPSHLSEGASLKEVTLSPISESHSEETIPSDSGIGTDNNSTSDQTEKGPASRRRYSFDLCGFESAEAAALETSGRNNRARCERQVAAVDNFLSQPEKKQKHHRRKRKCLPSRDQLHFLAELEEVVIKLQQLRVSHRRYPCYSQHPYPSIFRLNFHHYYPVTYDSYPYDSSSYIRRSAELKAKRRRGRPVKANEPITSKLPFVQGYGYPLPGGNYYAAPYAVPYAPHLSLGYFPPGPPFYLPHHSLGATPPSPFMRPAVPPPKAFHSAGHSKLQSGLKLCGVSGPPPTPSLRGEGLGSVSSVNAGGLSGVRLHKRKHKHKHKHKEEPLLSQRERQDLGGLFSGAKTSAHHNMMSDRREFTSQGSAKNQDVQRGRGRTSSHGSSLGLFESDQLSPHSVTDNPFHSRQTGQQKNSFMSSYASQSQCLESSPVLFLGSQDDKCVGRSKKARHSVFGDQDLMSVQTSRQVPEQMNSVSTSPLSGAPSKRRYKRREVEQIQKDVRRMHSLNFEHVQKILRAKRLQRQAKTGNNVIKRRPGRPRKQTTNETEKEEHQADSRGSQHLAGGRGNGRTLGMPVLERCDDLPGRQSLRPSLTPEPREFPSHDSVSATIETVVHKARTVPPLAKGGKRKSRGHSRDELWAPSSK
ncbi:SET-binding protein [Synchiropus picturatus]